MVPEEVLGVCGEVLVVPEVVQGVCREVLVVPEELLGYVGGSYSP